MSAIKCRVANALQASDWFIRWGASGLAWVAGLRYFWRGFQDPSVWWRIHYSHPEWIYGAALVAWLCFGGILTALIFAALADLIKTVSEQIFRPLIPIKDT